MSYKLNSLDTPYEVNVTSFILMTSKLSMSVLAVEKGVKINIAWENEQILFKKKTKKTLKLKTRLWTTFVSRPTSWETSPCKQRTGFIQGPALYQWALMSLSLLALIAAPCVTWSSTVPFQITWPPPSFHTCWIRQPTILRRGCDRTLVVGPKLLLCFLQGDTEEAALRFDFVLDLFFISLMFFIVILLIFANVWLARGR